MQSADSAPAPARFARSARNSAWVAHTESPQSSLASSPASRRCLPRISVTPRHSRDRSSILVDGSASSVADVPAALVVPVSQAYQSRCRLPSMGADLHVPGRLPRADFVADLPAVVPVARSVAPASPTSARTASAATDSAATSDVRSPTRAIAAAHASRGVARVPLPASPATFPDRVCSGREVWRTT